VLNMCDLRWRLPHTSGWTSNAIETFTGHDYLNIHFQHQSAQTEQLIEAEDKYKTLLLEAEDKYQQLRIEADNSQKTRDSPVNAYLKHGWANKMVALLAALQAGNTDKIEQLMELCLGCS
jgi:hypothetical protein